MNGVDPNGASNLTDEKNKAVQTWKELPQCSHSRSTGGPRAGLNLIDLMSAKDAFGKSVK